MKVLLINANPAVSRMFALCTRNEDIVLDEVKRIDALKDADYDLLFVNDASYEEEISVLFAKKRIRKKVFISYNEEPVEGFDLTIKKPFLPSQIIEVIESIDMSEEIEEDEEEMLTLSSDSEEEQQYKEEVLPPIFPLISKEGEDILEIAEEDAPEVLDSKEVEKIKALLDMDEETTENEPVDDDEYEARKVKVIKEQLIADGLEIIEEEAIVEELSMVVVEPSKKKSKKKKKKKELPFSKKELTRIEAAVEIALAKMKPGKMQKLLKGKKIEIKIKLEDEA